MHPFKSGDKVKCLNAPFDPYVTIQVGQVYTVVDTKFRANDMTPLVRLAGKGESWFMTKRFELVGVPAAPVPSPPTLRSVPSGIADEREERYRAMLTTPTDPFTCKKCGAPKATCTYH